VVPAACLEVCPLANGPASAYSGGRRSLHNASGTLSHALARWLLMMRDRTDDDTLPISQSLLAEMLGVQRPSITNVAQELERAGLIARGRQQITILNRKGLTQASCECYQLVRARLAFHLPKTYI
jgi:hypothetical protein